jgi:hypothetical protein
MSTIKRSGFKMTQEKPSPFKLAKRERAYFKGAIKGVAGSGKSYSMLMLLLGMSKKMGKKIAIIDTENGSINLYDHLGEFYVLPFDPPFHPERYIKAIDLCVANGFELIGLDSISPEWSGVGGCLDIHSNLGGQFHHWAKVTPMHNAFIDSILQAKAHIICTMRSKQDYAIGEKNGKKIVEKLGLKEIQRDTVEYEFSTVLNVEQNHFALASKDRTGLFSDSIPFIVTEKDGERLFEWSMGSTKNPQKTIVNHAPGATP